jgi:hypothetical protein
MTRIRLYLENVEDTEDARVGAYFAVRGDFGVFYVTPTMAERIERALDRRDVAQWLKFTDWVGSRVRVRAVQVRAIVEITPEQRAGERKFERALRLEEKADRRAWEDDC